jgi:hypothetical protein
VHWQGCGSALVEYAEAQFIQRTNLDLTSGKQRFKNQRYTA